MPASPWVKNVAASVQGDLATVIPSKVRGRAGLILMSTYEIEAPVPQFDLLPLESEGEFGGHRLRIYTAYYIEI